MKLLLRVGFLLAALGLALGNAQPVAAGSSEGAGGWEILGEHTVRKGETLYCIGRAYGVDPWAIATQNAIAYDGLIHPGTVLSIPNIPKTLVPGPICTVQFDVSPEAAASLEATPDATASTAVDPTPSPEAAADASTSCEGCTCRWTHLVTWGNTLRWIAITYAVDMQEIVRCNCIDDPNYIRAGASLCIP